MRKSEIIELGAIAREIVSLWKFNPYDILTSAPSINRYSTPFEVECKNCNSRIVGTFADLELYHSRGYYCPECQGSFNPVYNGTLPKDMVEQDPNEIPKLQARYTIMSEIEEFYKCKPYKFISIDSGRTVRLEHIACSSIFTATASMLFKNREIKDRFNGQPLILPYCPKCDSTILTEGMNYGGVKFIEIIHNYFKNGNKELPYSFDEEDVYRYKGLDSRIVVRCKHCNTKFQEIAEDLFTNDRSSRCPICKGIPKTGDSSETSIVEVQNEVNKMLYDENQNLESMRGTIVPEDIDEDYEERSEEIEESAIDEEYIATESDILNPLAEIVKDDVQESFEESIEPVESTESFEDENFEDYDDSDEEDVSEEDFEDEKLYSETQNEIDVEENNITSLHNDEQNVNYEDTEQFSENIEDLDITQIPESVLDDEDWGDTENISDEYDDEQLDEQLETESVEVNEMSARENLAKIFGRKPKVEESKEKEEVQSVEQSESQVDIITVDNPVKEEVERPVVKAINQDFDYSQYM